MSRITTMSLAGEETIQGALEAHEAPEVYEIVGDKIVRTVARRDGRHHSTDVPVAGTTLSDDAYSEYWRSWLFSNSAPAVNGSDKLTVADLFSGCGGLSVGVREACRAIGLAEQVVLAVDTNEAAMAVYVKNFHPLRIHPGGIEELVDGNLGEALTSREAKLATSLDGLTLAVGGPPCQGHSDLNNHTRRQDPKNALYLRMARFIEVARPEHAIIENVPGVVHDRSGVVGRTTKHLMELGYNVATRVLAADELGWAQRRKRHILLASRSNTVDPDVLAAQFHRPAQPVSWALGPSMLGSTPFMSSAVHSSANQSRIAYLFEHGLYELPDSQRPDCHRLKPHSYRSVYGRMRPNEPAPTITSGFGSTGQGRFVHPFERRTMTPNEAARVQGFPNWFDFDATLGRRALQEMIGNAVPSRLGYVAAMGLLR